MKKLKIQFKNIKYFEGMEGTGVNADIHINGVKCLFMRDSGDGGETDFDIYKGKDTIQNETIVFNLKLADEYIDQLTPHSYNIGNGEKHYLKYDRSLYFNEMLEVHEEEKQQKKIDKLCKTSIVFGNKHAYGYVNFKRPLENVDVNILKLRAQELRNKYCTTGEMSILNKNLTILGVTF